MVVAISAFVAMIGGALLYGANTPNAPAWFAPYQDRQRIVAWVLLVGGLAGFAVGWCARFIT